MNPDALARRVESLEACLRVAEGRISAQDIVLDVVLRAVASSDRSSASALALAIEVAEADRADLHGEDDEIVKALRRLRERLDRSLGGPRRSARTP